MRETTLAATLPRIIEMSKRTLAAFFLSFGCVVAKAGTPTTNPSFPVSVQDARAHLKVMAATPRRLERPLIILGGFLDMGVGPSYYARRLRDYVRGDIIRIGFADCTDFPSCRRRVIERLDAVLGEWSGRETVEVDVIGQSMGGLIAYYAAMNDPALGKRLKVRRLFTISSPLQGSARAAKMPAVLDVLPLIRDMRPNSDLYKRLATVPADFELVSYTLLNDPVVGERFAAGPGRVAWWLPAPSLMRAHGAAMADERIMLDIVRRLRGEKPLTVEPAASLPAGTTDEDCCPEPVD